MYDIAVQYFDIWAGVSTYTLSVNGSTVATWKADDKLPPAQPDPHLDGQTSTRFTVHDVKLKPGDVLELRGVPDLRLICSMELRLQALRAAKECACSRTCRSTLRLITLRSGPADRLRRSKETEQIMKITAARLIVCSPDRNFVTLKIETDEGIYGLGDGTLNGRELAVAAYLEEHVIPCLIGRDPSQIEDIWQYLYRGAYWRRGPVTMSAIAAVDVALWDIKGKALNTPVYNLLGGASRQGCLVYTHANGADIGEAIDSVQKHMSNGYLAVRAQAGVPGVASSYGVPKGGKPYEPAERGLPS